MFVIDGLPPHTPSTSLALPVATVTQDTSPKYLIGSGLALLATFAVLYWAGRCKPDPGFESAQLAPSFQQKVQT